jgi:hypothetical protein
MHCVVPAMPKVACPRGSQCDNPPVTDSAGQKVREPPFGDPMVYCTGSRRTKNPRCSLKCTDAKRPYITTENAMMRALVFGAAALTLSAGAASAQAVYPSYGHAPYGYGYTATAPLYDYAGPASSAPVHTAPHGYSTGLRTTTLRTDSCLPSAAGGARLLHSAVSRDSATVL